MYLLLFLLIVGIGIVISYIYFMREKKANLMAIERGICPKCHKLTIEIIDQRSTGCSSPKMITVECKECKYNSVFHISNSGCSGGSCGI